MNKYIAFVRKSDNVCNFVTVLQSVPMGTEDIMHIEMPEYMDVLWHKYENGVWSNEMFTPKDVTVNDVNIVEKKIEAESNRLDFVEELIAELAIKVYGN